MSTCDVCRICVSLLLCVSAASSSNASTHDQLANVVQDQDDTDWDSPFHQLRTSLPAHSQPIRPYALLTNAEDYHYLPKPKHYRPSRLLRLLGSFNPFWMSIDQPPEDFGVWSLAEELSDGRPAKLPNYTTYNREKFNFNVSMELREAAAKQRQDLEREAADVDLSGLPSDVAGSVRAWLINSAQCQLRFQWVDLGLAFWPRWLRQTDCEKGARSCSFPRGMECTRARTTQIKILAWHCLEINRGGEELITSKSDRSDGITVMGAKCIWRQVPYPVVTACTCACK